MKTKYVEIVILYLLCAIVFGSGCVGQPAIAPLDGDVANLYSGFAKHIAENGGLLVRSYFSSSTGITVWAKPYLDGWAVVLGKGTSYIGYFMNSPTWARLEMWLTSPAAGFVIAAKYAPAVLLRLNMPIITLPASFTDFWSLPGLGDGMGS
jgi:hypothetical protein